MNNKLTTSLILSPSQKKVHAFLEEAYSMLQSLTDTVGELAYYDGIEQDLETLQSYIDSASEQVTSLAESVEESNQPKEEYVLTDKYDPTWIYERRSMTLSEYQEERSKKSSSFLEWYKVGEFLYDSLGIGKLPNHPCIEEED